MRSDNNIHSLHWLIILISLILYFSFGLYHITKFDTADEHFWIGEGRISQYWKAVGEQNWKATRINDKPGITLAYISGIGASFNKNNSEIIQERAGALSRYDPQKFQDINFLYRLPLLVFNGLFSIFFFWVVYRLTKNPWIGLWTVTLVLLSPILLGVSQIVNPDTLSWTFSGAAILSYFLLLKEKSKRIVLLTATLLGLALATKYIALIAFYFLFFVLLAYILHEYKKDSDGQIFSREISRLAISYLAVVAGALLIFSILMPAVFIKSKYLFHEVINFGHTGWVFWAMVSTAALIIIDSRLLKSKILFFILGYVSKCREIAFKCMVSILLGACLFTLINWISGINFFNLEAVPFDSRQSDFFGSLPVWQKFILQARPIIFSLTPVVLFPLLYILVKTILGKTKDAFYVYMVSLFVLMYWVAVVAQDLLTNIRYGIILQPLIIFLAALGLWEISGDVKIIKLKNNTIISLALIIISSMSLWLIKPFYFNYTNSLLPKTSVIAGAWGYGGYEAAQFINSHSKNSKNTAVVADYPGVCPFVDGYCTDISNDNRKKVINFLNQNQDNVYFVLTRRGQVRWGYIGQFIEVRKKPPLWKLDIDGRPGNFIEVYKHN